MSVGSDRDVAVPSGSAVQQVDQIGTRHEIVRRHTIVHNGLLEAVRTNAFQARLTANEPIVQKVSRHRISRADATSVHARRSWWEADILPLSSYRAEGMISYRRI